MDARVSFRASAPLAEALALRAEANGLTLSDYVRSILSAHVTLVSDDDPPPPIEITVTPQPVHQQAANGDATAFAQLASWHYQRGLNGDEPHVIAYARASDLSRFALLARNDRQDWLSHIFLLEAYGTALRNAGLGSLSDTAIAESVALAETMAEQGDEEMASLIATGAGNVSPEAMTLARDLQRHAKETAGC